MSFWVILGLIAPPAAAIDDFDAAVEVARHDVPVVEEGVLLEADVHEGGLEAVFEVADLAFEDAADEALLVVRSMVNSSSLPSSTTRHAGFERLGVDDDFLVESS